MIARSLPFVCLCVIFFGCDTKHIRESRAEDIKESIIANLNKHDAVAALEVTERELKNGNSDPEIKYYKACALAMYAGIDVFAFYDVLQMKIFHNAVIDWGKKDRLVMNGFLAISQTLTLVNKLPAITNGKEDSVEEAISILMELDTKKTNAYLFLLSSVMVLDLIRKTSKSRSSEGFAYFCGFDSEVFAQSFTKIKYYSTLCKKTQNNLFLKLDEFINQLADEDNKLSKKSKQDIDETVERVKNVFCK